MQPSQSYISQKDIKRLSVLQPGRTVLAIAVDWAVIVATIALCERTGSWLLYLAGVAVIAGRMHALATIIHEFAHYRFIRNKEASNWIGDVVLAWPLLATVEGYRKNHLSHHRYLNTDDDPDWTFKLGAREFTFPQEMRFAVLNLLGYLVGVSSVRDLAGLIRRISKDDDSTLGYKLLRLACYAAVAVGLTLAHAWQGFLLYWLVPYITLFFLIMYVRSVAEHFGSTMDHSHELTASRTVIPHFWERWFFAPHNINFHLEHHLYPSIPFYGLRELHALLMANPAFARQAHLTRGYTTGLVRETIASSATPGDAPMAPAA